LPILGSYRVVTTFAKSDPLQESRTLAFRALDGTNPFPSTGREVFVMAGAEGLDMPPRVVVTRQSPGMDGEQLREIRTGRREVFLPLFLASDSSHLQYLERRDALRRLFAYRGVDYKAQDGTFDLVAESARGERSLRCVFVEGMTSAMRPDESAYWARLGLTFWAVQPYWVGQPWTTPVIRQETGAAWFGAFPPRLSSARALNQAMTVTIPGDAPSPVTVDLVGPATTVTITGPGLFLSIPSGLAIGEVARIVTDPRRRQATFDGVTDWARLAPTSTWAPLTPGDVPLSVTVTGQTASTQAVISGNTYFETPW
jgi:hypothetical protein